MERRSWFGFHASSGGTLNVVGWGSFYFQGGVKTPFSDAQLYARLTSVGIWWEFFWGLLPPFVGAGPGNPPSTSSFAPICQLAQFGGLAKTT